MALYKFAYYYYYCEVEGNRSIARPKTTWKVVDNDVKCFHLHASYALDCKKWLKRI